MRLAQPRELGLAVIDVLLSLLTQAWNSTDARKQDHISSTTSEPTRYTVHMMIHLRSHTRRSKPWWS
jgi:hypothetical protein